MQPHFAAPSTPPQLTIPQVNNRLLILAALMAAAASGMAQQQMPKMDGALSKTVRQQRQQRAVTAPLTVIVRCSDAEAVARLVELGGHTARIILPTLLTATAPADFLPTLAASDLVESLQMPTHYKAAMTEARQLTGVDAVHQGLDLETPFTGRGVVLGVIDQGFEYRHPAFLDAQGHSRVRAVWNRSESLDNVPVTDIPALGDKGGGGHASHVTNIAAGIDVGNQLHGVASEAEIVMIPSSFLDYEVLEDVRWIKETAEAEGKPWVVNMSFGTTVGPHDGTGGCCREIDALTGPGGVIVAAMGNEGGQTIHLGATLQPGEAKYVLCKGGTDGYLFVDFWANDADAQAHFKITPVTYVNYKLNEHDADFWKPLMPDDVYTGSFQEINLNNGKQHEQYIIDMQAAAHALGTSFSAAKSIIGFKFELAEGETQPRTLHGWTSEGHGSFSTVSISSQKANMLTPDDQFLVAEGTACIPSAVAVASLNSSTTFRSFRDGAMYDYQRFVGGEGTISTFSNAGPWIGADKAKPLLCAPGAIIKSAVSKLADGFDANDPLIVDKIVDGSGEAFYYSAMQGTSMASPFVAGAVCLWLEANPALGYDEIVSIIRQTAVVDDGIAAAFPQIAEGMRDTWSPRAGYGRIDVYAGLQKALALAEASGIERVGNSEQPFTISRGADGWRILCNNSERGAEVRVFSVDGRQLLHHSLGALRQGEEFALPFTGLPAGTYLINLATSRSNVTRRVMVQ